MDNFCRVCAAGLSEPYPIIVYSVVNYRFLVTFGQICNFRDPKLVTFYLSMYLILNKKHLTFQ